MTKDDARERIEELRDEIQRHDYLYYVESEPEISDEKYDELFAELQELEEEYPDLQTDDSPTQRVGAPPLDAFPTVEHEAPMLSLDSDHERSALERFVQRVRAASTDGEPAFSVEPKFDGLSVEFVYVDGSLERAATRGDGSQGEGITENVRTIGSVPLKLRDDDRDVPSMVSLRGEVYMPVEGFSELNERLMNEGKEPFANPRNAAAGSLRQLDSSITAERPLDVYFYDMLAVEGADFSTQKEVRAALEAWGLRVNDCFDEATSVDDIADYHAELDDERDDLDYEIDGVVAKVDDFELREKMGSTSRHPRWAFAYKFTPRKEETKILDIILSVGRTGVVTPVATLRPVEIGGVTVSRATLHNREEVKRKDIRKGDTVRVQRAGDVIPQVVEVVDTEGDREPEFEMPEECPSCGTELVERGPYTVCPNSFGCPAQLAGRLQHVTSRDALDIEGVGGEKARLLVEEGLVESVPDLFELKRQDLMELEGFGEKSADKLLAEIEAASPAPLYRFLIALGIPEVGGSMARDLARHFGDFEAVRNADEDDLREVEGVGEKVAEQIAGFFADERTSELIDRLLDHVDVESTETGEGGALQGLTIVFTGGLERFTRDEAKDLVERNGGDATSSVSGNTDYVVAGEEPGSKLDEARDRGVEVLDEEAFVELLQERGATVEP